jgi:hypothetical protein
MQGLGSLVLLQSLFLHHNLIRAGPTGELGKWLSHKLPLRVEGLVGVFEARFT